MSGDELHGIFYLSNPSTLYYSPAKSYRPNIDIYGSNKVQKNDFRIALFMRVAQVRGMNFRFRKTQQLVLGCQIGHKYFSDSTVVES